jgi:hypothetical protein
MTATVGQTITFRPALGKVKTMRVEMVHVDAEGTRWLFSGVDALGNFVAVNSKWVLKVS